MWICAACGTQAQQPDVCSGCGSPMRPFNQPKENRYEFVVVSASTAVYGPFPSVMAADQWADGNLNGNDHKVVLMENPNDRAS